MKEHGLLFTAPMVRALLAGTKTQTRRLVKPQPPAGYEFNEWVVEYPGTISARLENKTPPLGMWTKRAPHGPVGRVIYAKETWCRAEAWYPAASVAYRADYGDHEWKKCEPGVCSRWRTGVPSFDCMACNFTRWVPSIHMPRWAARLWFEVTRVRLERVQAITSRDAWDEGVRCGCLKPTPFCAGGIVAYRKIWDEINGSGSWASNPWVWVYDFKRIAKPALVTP